VIIRLLSSSPSPSLSYAHGHLLLSTRRVDDQEHPSPRRPRGKRKISLPSFFLLLNGSLLLRPLVKKRFQNALEPYILVNETSMSLLPFTSDLNLRPYIPGWSSVTRFPSQKKKAFPMCCSYSSSFTRGDKPLVLPFFLFFLGPSFRCHSTVPSSFPSPFCSASFFLTTLSPNLKGMERFVPFNACGTVRLSRAKEVSPPPVLLMAR